VVQLTPDKGKDPVVRRVADGFVVTVFLAGDPDKDGTWSVLFNQKAQAAKSRAHCRRGLGPPSVRIPVGDAVINVSAVLDSVLELIQETNRDHQAKPDDRREVAGKVKLWWEKYKSNAP
jgi:hypothetical protein